VASDSLRNGMQLGSITENQGDEYDQQIPATLSREWEYHPSHLPVNAFRTFLVLVCALVGSWKEMQSGRYGWRQHAQGVHWMTDWTARPPPSPPANTPRVHFLCLHIADLQHLME